MSPSFTSQWFNVKEMPPRFIMALFTISKKWRAGHWWLCHLMLLATQEAEIRRITV
jgi:hypothetical protein